MKATQFITRHSRLILLVSVLLLIPSFIGIGKTGVDYNVLNYLPTYIESMKGMEILDKEFGDASSATLVIEKKTVREIMDLKDKIAKVDGVDSIVGVDDIIDPNIPREMLPAAIRDSLFSGEGTLTIIRFEEGTATPRTEAAVVKIRKLLDADCYLSGTTASNLDSRQVSNREMPIYLGLAVILVIVILGLTMESWIIPFIFLASIGLAIIYNLGSNVILGKVSSLTQSLAAVLQLGVTMDFSIFLLHRYDEERKNFADHRDAMASAIQKTFSNITGSALTDIAGFMALCVMNLKLGADIGIVMSKGVVLGLFTTVTILPAMILALDGPIHKYRHHPLMFKFKKLAAFSTKHAIPLAIVFVLLFIPAIYGKNNTKQDYDLSGGLSLPTPSNKAAQKVKDEYKMMTTHFVIVRKDLPPVAIRDMIASYEKVEGVSGVIAMEKYIGALIPEEFLPESVKSIFKNGNRELLIVTSTYPTSSPGTMEQLGRIIEITKAVDPDCLVTGEGALSKDLVAIANDDFKRVDLVSIIAIFLIVLFLFTSLSIPVLLVSGIELSIIINLGLPFYLNQSISFMSSIVIGCIQLGVTIDYTILLVSRFREELQAGLSRKEAMRKALSLSAPSIFTSVIILSAVTAVVALVSSQGILSSICSLLSRGSVISMCVIFFLMPAVLLLSEKIISKTSLNWRKPPIKKPLSEKESSL